MPSSLQFTTDDAQHWRALFDAVSSLETCSMRQVYERRLAQHGAKVMARVHQDAMRQLIKGNCDLLRLDLGNAFRRIMSDAIDVHFAGLDLADPLLCLSLADNAKEWLTFMHCMTLAEKVSFHEVHAGYLTTYGDAFMVEVYQKTFEQVLQHRAPSESVALLTILQQALDQTLETMSRYAAA